jgi:hypothetical protein
MLREELQLLQEPGSYVGEVIKVISVAAAAVAWEYRHVVARASPVCLWAAAGSSDCAAHLLMALPVDVDRHRRQA